MLTPLPNKSPLLEKIGGVVAISVIFLMFASLVLPFFAAWAGIEITDQDRAVLGPIETTISNVFVAVVTFFFGSSARARQQDDTINKAQTAQVQLAATAAVAAGATVPPTK